MTDSTLARVVRHYRGYRRQLAAVSAIALLGALLEAASYALIVPLATAAFAKETSYTFPFAGTTWTLPVAGLFASAVCTVLGHAVVVLVEEYTASRLTTRYTATQQRRAVRALLDARWAVQAQEAEGKLQDLLSTHLYRAQMGLRNLAVGLRALVAVAIFLGGAVAFGGAYVLVLLAVFGLLFACLQPLARRTRENSRVLAQESPRYANLIAQTIRMAREIRLFWASEAVVSKTDAVIERYRSATMRQRMLGAAAPAIYQAVGLLLVISGIALVFWADLGRPETLAATAILTLKALQYGRGVQHEYHVCNDLLPFAEELEARLQGLESARDQDAGVTLARVGHLRLQDVGFGYDADRPVLTGITFDLAAGESLGIIGPSGAGKTTLLQLLLRLRDPEQGSILVDGRPSQEVSKSSWYRRVAYVPQEPQLFSDTILENIRAYRPGVSREDAIRAAQEAGIAAEIEAIPAGYDAEAGEKGGHLSGGQRQRLCIARALAGRPDLIVFDEPTSALDAHSEAVVQETLRRLQGKVTLVIVAHRLSTLTVCARILVLREGRMEAFGPREDLMRESAYFHEALRLSLLR